jgi:hypothetical protein
LAAKPPQNVAQASRLRGIKNSFKMRPGKIRLLVVRHRRLTLRSTTGFSQREKHHQAQRGIPATITSKFAGGIFDS